MIQLSAQDTAFLHMEKPRVPWNGGVVTVYDRTTAPGAVSFQDVLDHFQERLDLIEALRMKVVRVPGNLGRPYWVEDPNVNLENHIQNIALPSPGDWRQFCLQVSRSIARPLDLTRPLWEVDMIDGLDAIERFPNGSFGLVFKVHHAALDGTAWRAIMDVLHNADPNGAPPSPPDQAHRVESEPSPMSLLVRAGVNAAVAPLAGARALVGAAPGLARVVVPMLRRRLSGDAKHATPTPRTPRLNGPLSAYRSWGACFFDLADTKPIRTAVEGATVGDIAVCVFGGALRTYLGELGELPTESLKVGIMMSAHAAGDRVGLGNQLFAMFASLATDVENPLERLAAVRASTLGAKNVVPRTEGRGVMGLMESIPEVALDPLLALTWGVGDRSGHGMFGAFNTVITGMPGPSGPLYLGGAELIHLIGFSPMLNGLRLINIHNSYNGEFVMTFSADREAMPNPQRYEECIYQAFDELRQAVRSGKKRSGR